MHEVRERGGVRFIEGRIEGVGDALDLVAACAEEQTDRLLLDGAHLADEFFDLSTRLAGEVVQKFQNYRIRTAAVFVDDGSYSEPFTEFIREARTSNDFRTFTDREAAEEWLVS